MIQVKKYFYGGISVGMLEHQPDTSPVYHTYVLSSDFEKLETRCRQAESEVQELKSLLSLIKADGSNTTLQRDWIRNNYDALIAAGWRDPEAPKT